MKPKKLLRIPLRVIDQIVENKTGGLIDLSEIFLTVKDDGNALGAELVVSMPDGYSAQILWDPDGPVSSSQVIAVVQSILAGHPCVTSISVLTPQTSSPEPVTPYEKYTDPISGGSVTIRSEPIEQLELELYEDDDASE
jgi:hypothetical protein